MPIFNYGSKNGMSTLIIIVKQLCKLYLKFQEPILEYINASGLDTEQKTTITDWLNLGSTACGILVSLQYTYEN